MLTIRFSSKFKKDFRKIKKQPDLGFDEILELLLMRIGSHSDLFKS